MSLNTSRWRIVSSSVIGSGHIARGVPCEDFHALDALPSGVWVGVVADGAGSARCAAEGSRVAATAATKFLSKRLSDLSAIDEAVLHSAMRDCLQHAREALEGLVATKSPDGNGEALPQYATTLLAICVTERWISALQLGDGAIVLRQRAGDLMLVFQPSHGEYINETHFLTSPDFAERAQFRVLPAQDTDAIAMLTDGIEILALDYANASPHGPFFQPMFTFASNIEATEMALEEFLKSDRVCERTDDDKTLLLAIRQ
jgi:hypothetical protein